MIYGLANAKVTGNCANCHTMHNSQNGTAMATYGADGQPWKGTGPYGALVRGECLGCHGMGPTKTVTIGGSVIPQVYHTDTSDLAGGNFRYVLGDDSKGHNVVDTGNQEGLAAMFPPPGFPRTPSNHTTVYFSQTNFTCAGYHGCHGSRQPYTDKISGLPALKGAHHQNVNGKCDTATANYNSYRFLRGVRGLENTGWQNVDANNHNEYFGATTPMSNLGGGPGPPDQSITCSRCHDDSVTPSVVFLTDLYI